jgi:hypothetical protein
MSGDIPSVQEAIQLREQAFSIRKVFGRHVIVPHALVIFEMGKRPELFEHEAMVIRGFIKNMVGWRIPNLAELEQNPDTPWQIPDDRPLGHRLIMANRAALELFLRINNRDETYLHYTPGGDPEQFVPRRVSEYILHGDELLLLSATPHPDGEGSIQFVEPNRSQDFFVSVFRPV